MSECLYQGDYDRLSVWLGWFDPRHIFCNLLWSFDKLLLERPKCWWQDNIINNWKEGYVMWILLQWLKMRSSVCSAQHYEDERGNGG